MSKKSYGIIGQLYHNGFKPLHIFKTTNDYFSFLFSLECNTPTQAGIMLYDYFTITALQDIKKSLSSADTFLDRIRKYTNDLSQEQKNTFNNVLLTITSTIETYAISNVRSSKQDFDPSILESYDFHELEKIRSYYSAKENTYNLAYNIYLLTYLAVYKHLPSNFFFGINYQSQLDEFNTEVTCKYGVTSKPGIRAIINLAKRKDPLKDPNLFAMYEYADILYYGRENGPAKDINMAFDIYKSISSTSDQSHCHPLALWTLSYIYFNYHQPKSELECCDTIPSIESLSRLEQVSEAIRYAKYAFSLDSNPAAANILGKISLLTDDDVDGMYELKKKYQLKEPVDYFKEAVSQNYIYAYGNLSWIYLERIFNDDENINSNLDSYLRILKLQAEQNEPWAANTLGVFYHDGIVKSKKTEQTKYFKEYIDFSKSFLFLNMAIQSEFTDQNSAWALANILVFFPERFFDRTDLIELHLIKISQIDNPKAKDFLHKHFESIYNSRIPISEYDRLINLLES